MKWNPLRDLIALQNKINRLFEESLSGTRFSEETLSFGTWLPPVDMFETPDSIILKAELPGMDRKDFSVTIKNDTLILKGERKFKKTIKGGHYNRVERTYGSFQRIFALPCEVKGSEIEAKYTNGVLEIVLQKDERAKTKQVKIEVE